MTKYNVLFVGTVPHNNNNPYIRKPILFQSDFDFHLIKKFLKQQSEFIDKFNFLICKKCTFCDFDGFHKDYEDKIIDVTLNEDSDVTKITDTRYDLIYIDTNTVEFYIKSKNERDLKEKVIQFFKPLLKIKGVIFSDSLSFIEKYRCTRNKELCAYLPLIKDKMLAYSGLKNSDLYKFPGTDISWCEYIEENYVIYSKFVWNYARYSDVLGNGYEQAFFTYFN